MIAWKYLWDLRVGDSYTSLYVIYLDPKIRKSDQASEDLTGLFDPLCRGIPTQYLVEHIGSTMTASNDAKSKAIEIAVRMGCRVACKLEESSYMTDIFCIVVF